jgi:hypothetical protein
VTVTLKTARAALFAVLPAEVLAAVLLISGVPLPGPVLVLTELAVAAVLLLEGVTAYRLYVAALRRGAGRRAALRTAYRELVPVKVRRVMSFDAKGLASLALWLMRRRDGVPPGAVALPYSREQSPFLLLILFVTVLETIGTEVLLRGLGAPAGLRAVLLVLDLYASVAVLAIWAAGVTRPHVVSGTELRVRCGAFVDARVPRASIASARVAHSYNERGMVSVEEEGRLAVAVSSRTNVVVELREPVTVIRPLGGEARIAAIRFFCDDPRPALEALRERPTPVPRPAGRPAKDGA